MFFILNGQNVLVYEINFLAKRLVGFFKNEWNQFVEAFQQEKLTSVKNTSRNRPIAKIKDGEIVESDDDLLPFFLKRTGNVEGWLASRAIDAHRTNSRLLKKALRLRQTDDVATALNVIDFHRIFP